MNRPSRSHNTVRMGRPFNFSVPGYHTLIRYRFRMEADYPKAVKWELQEKLFAVTIQQGARVNILLAQKAKWHTDQEYEIIRKRIEGELVVVK